MNSVICAVYGCNKFVAHEYQKQLCKSHSIEYRKHAKRLLKKQCETDLIKKFQHKRPTEPKNVKRIITGIPHDNSNHVKFRRGENTK